MRWFAVIIALAGCDAVFGLDGRDARGADDAATADTSIDAATGYAATVLLDHPVAYYRLGESSGVTCVDAVGDIDGTYGGTFALGETGIPMEVDTAARFGPGNAGIVFGDVHERDGTKPFSLELWAKITDDTHYNNLIAKYEEPPMATGYLLYTGYERLGFARGVTEAAQTLVELQGYEANRFVHIVGTYDGTDMRLYVDGVLVGEMPSSIVLPDRSIGFTIGSGNGSIASGPAEGVLDEVALYDYALSPARVFAHYTAGREPVI
jgi:hypothetical protein